MPRQESSPPPHELIGWLEETPARRLAPARDLGAAWHPCSATCSLALLLRPRGGMKDKVRHALNEARILILGTQVFLGFQYRSVLEPGFDHLPRALQRLSLVGLGLLIVTFALLVTPASYHRIVEDGRATARVHRFTSLTLAATLLPLALAFGVATFVAVERITTGGALGGLAAGLTVATALACWYALPLALHAIAAQKEDRMTEQEDTSLKDKVEHVLTELRMVLPGAQALLGFGFTAVLMDSFGHLPAASQVTHFAGLGCVLLATILLMTPAARHRIAEGGEDTEAFHRFTSRVLLIAMALLALGVAAQVIVVLRRVEDSLPLAALGAAATLAVCFGLWFGLTGWRRARDGRRRVAELQKATGRKAA